jgi:hypothetical protein
MDSMKIEGKSDFIKTIQNLGITSECVIIKPNWLSNGEGEYTEPELLRWLFEALPDRQYIVVEGYTPWRGLIYEPKYKGDELRVDLEGGKAYREFYRLLDKKFLSETGIGEVLHQFNAEYINITEEVWGGRCVDSDKIRKQINENGYFINYIDFYSYMPLKLYQLRNDAAFISLAKIKLQANKPILISASIKNLYGLIPHPSRMVYHDVDDNYAGLAESMSDIFILYTELFKNNYWINEGIFTLIKKHFGENQSVERDMNYLVVGTDPLTVDAEACGIFGLDPFQSVYYRYIATHLDKRRS